MLDLNGKTAYTAKETGAILQMTPCAVRNFVKDGRLKGEKVNGRYCVYADSIQQFAHDMDEKGGAR